MWVKSGLKLVVHAAQLILFTTAFDVTPIKTLEIVTRRTKLATSAISFVRDCRKSTCLLTKWYHFQLIIKVINLLFDKEFKNDLIFALRGRFSKVGTLARASLI